MGYVIVVDESGKREVLGDLEQYRRQEFGSEIKPNGRPISQSEIDEKDKVGE